jgi:hypothetical protein
MLGLGFPASVELVCWANECSYIETGTQTLFRGCGLFFFSTPKPRNCSCPFLLWCLVSELYINNSRIRWTYAPILRRIFSFAVWAVLMHNLWNYTRSKPSYGLQYVSCELTVSPATFPDLKRMLLLPWKQAWQSGLVSRIRKRARSLDFDASPHPQHPSSELSNLDGGFTHCLVIALWR